MKTIVLGPPGTGKTTTLLNKVEEHLKETDPNKIGYFSFTQKAANEGRERASQDARTLSLSSVPYGIRLCVWRRSEPTPNEPPINIGQVGHPKSLPRSGPSASRST